MATAAMDLIAQNIFPRSGGNLVARRETGRARRIGVADRGQGAELGKVADEVLAPLAATDHGATRLVTRRGHVDLIVER